MDQGNSPGWEARTMIADCSGWRSLPRGSRPLFIAATAELVPLSQLTRAVGANWSSKSCVATRQPHTEHAAGPATLTTR